MNCSKCDKKLGFIKYKTKESFFCGSCFDTIPRKDPSKTLNKINKVATAVSIISIVVIALGLFLMFT